MAQLTGIGKATLTPGIRKTSKSLPTSPVSTAPPIPSRSQAEASADDHISKYCCFLEKLNTCDETNPHGSGDQTNPHGSGFVVKFEGLQSGELLALNWERRGKFDGQIQTNYALITSHDTIPGLSLSELNGWTISCQGIEGGNEQTLSDLVCGVISCCGHASLFGPGHSDARIFLPHPNLSCQIELNITILYLNATFDEKLKESSGCTVFPPVISVKEHSQEHKQIISALSNGNGREECSSTHSVHVYHCSGPSGSLKTAVSLVEQQDTLEDKNPTVISWEIREFERSQKLCYKEPNSSTALVGRCYGSPVVYHNTAANEHTIIGVHVGETDEMGQFYAVTLHRIQQLLRGGLIPVLSVLSYFEAPRLWPSRWAYLVTPHITDQLPIDCGEILRYLLKDRFGTQLVKLSVDLADVDNKASLDLLCALFKHFDVAPDVDLNTESYDEGCNQGISDDIEQLCVSLLNLLEGAAREPKQKEIKPTVEVTFHDEGVRLQDRAELVEKCFEFYNRLLAIEYAGITEEILCTDESLELVEKIRGDPRYQSTAVDISETYQKILNTLESRHKEEKVMQWAAIRSPAEEKKQLKQMSDSSYFDSTSKKHSPIAQKSPTEESPTEASLTEESPTEESPTEESLPVQSPPESPQVELTTGIGISDGLPEQHIKLLKAENKKLRRQLDQKNSEFDGFEAFAETSFTVPDSHSHSFEWRGYGLKLHIPEGAVPVEHTGCRVNIKAGFTGQFTIPEDLHLVSGVYWLSCSQKFVKPVTLEIEHCASLQDSSQSSSLQFIAAKCSQAELPYQFKVLERGIFVPKSSYGSIQVSQFSLFAIGIFKRFHSLRCYCGTVHYIWKNVNMWEVDFVITSDLQASLSAIRVEYLNATSGPSFPIQFEDEAISLEIPDDGICLHSGWAITPLSAPIIEKQQVDRFKPGKLVPHCRLQVELDKSSKLVELKYKVKLLGTKGPHHFFKITCSPQVPPTPGPVIALGSRNTASPTRGGGTERFFMISNPKLKDLMEDLYHTVADKWKVIGLYLEIPKGKLASIEEKYQHDPQKCLVEMFEIWLERVNPSPTWVAIIEAVEFLGEEQLGRELREKYTQ